MAAQMPQEHIQQLILDAFRCPPLYWQMPDVRVEIPATLPISAGVVERC